MNQYFEDMALTCLEHREHSKLCTQSGRSDTKDDAEQTLSVNQTHRKTTPTTSLPHRAAADQTPISFKPVSPQRTYSGVVADFKKDVADEAKNATEDTNIHWPPQSSPVKKSQKLRRTSSLAMDWSDSIVNFRDDDGSYTSDCNHGNFDGDHRCSCKRLVRREDVGKSS